MRQEQVTLVLPDSAGPKYRRFGVSGAEFVRAAWSGNGKARETRKEFTDPAAAVVALRREADKALRAGFVRLGGAEDPVALEFMPPGKTSSRALDLHPDGHTVLIAYGGAIRLVDVATGVRRTVHAVPTAERLTGIDSVLFDATGTAVVYTVGGATRRLDLTTLHEEQLACYRQFEDALFNPYTVQPSWDAARRRLVVFDAGDRVRVLDAAGTQVFEVSTQSATTECRGAALSPSGRLLAVWRVSRGVVYGHRDATDDPTNEVEVWDVETGRPTARVPLAWEIGDLGFDPSETLLLVNQRRVNGPFALSIDTGEPAWHFTNPHHPNGWATCYAWAYSPDGGRIAIGGHRTGALHVYDANLREASSRPLPGYDDQRVRRLAFSTDGTLLATGGDFGRVFVRRV
ncbi:WD40 repeat domain-containing protein [Embleya sp. NPDC008237]|uniref:WD40 repeat domain-containing protein n=1 Tax=Embleya sp. NPDC008237 TaxID=3363978 RepID=UPI0036ECB3B4